MEHFLKYFEQQIRLFPEDAPGSEGMELKEELFSEDWEGGKKKIIVQNTLVPTLVPMFPDPKVLQENEPCPAIIVIPGGGFRRQVMNLEGTEIGEWLNRQGIAAFVLKCRLPINSHEHREDVALMDVQRAIRLLRANAKEWNINPNCIGVMGFSAGGHIASMASTCYNVKVYEPKDSVDVYSAKPDFAVLGYPAINLEIEEAGRAAQRQKGIQTEVAEYIRLIMGKYSTDLLVNQDTPQAFIFETSDDLTTPMEHSLRYYMACRHCNVPAELHVFQTGSHGFGLGDTRAQVGGWKELFLQWMKLQQ